MAKRRAKRLALLPNRRYGGLRGTPAPPYTGPLPFSRIVSKVEEKWVGTIGSFKRGTIRQIEVVVEYYRHATKGIKAQRVR